MHRFPMARVKFYAVRDGREKGIFTDWEACKRSVVGYSNAQYKSFRSKEEATAYLQDISDTGHSNTQTPATKSKQEVQDIPTRKRPATQSTLPYKKRRVAPIVVWTDGSCRNNGTERAVGGVGVYFGDNDLRYGGVEVYLFD